MTEWYFRTEHIVKLAEGAFENPLYPQEFIFMEGETPLAGIVFTQIDSRVPEKHVHVAELRALSKGGGRKAMNKVIERADEMGITLDLSAVPRRAGYYLKPMTLRKLIKWYKSFGFVLDSKMVDGHMIRYPKQKMTENPVYPKRRPSFKKGDKVIVIKGSAGAWVTGWKGEVLRVSLASRSVYRVAFPNGIETWVKGENLRLAYDENPIFPKRRGKHRSRPQHTGTFLGILRNFQNGDNVKMKDELTDSPFHGHSGIIIQANVETTWKSVSTGEGADMVEVPIHLVKFFDMPPFPSSRTTMVDADRLAPESMEENPIYRKKRPRFRVGDCVKVKHIPSESPFDKPDPYEGFVGEVREIISTPTLDDMRFRIAFTRPTDVFFNEYYEDELEPAESPC